MMYTIFFALVVVSAVCVTITELRREAPASLVGLWSIACLVVPVGGFAAWWWWRQRPLTRSLRR